MKAVEFLRLERKVDYKEEGALYRSVYFNVKPNPDKNSLYLIVADAFGLPYAFEISKLVRKHTSGKTQDPRMIVNMTRALQTKEFFIDENGEIDNLDKIIKKVVAEIGYR